MFIGREKELQKLNKLYRTKGFQFPVIYGRRRVGKTALITEFMKDKRAIFFTGIESNAQQNLENFSKSILSFTDETLENTVFPSFQAALEYVFKLAEKKRIILVIDEYPYVAKASKSLASTLQSLIDKHKGTSKLFLILCGSSMSFMENHVLAYKAPLYGRRTAQFKIQPFDFFESRRYFKNFSERDMAVIYGIVGGTPQYLLQMNDRLTLEENIKRNFFDPTSPLFEEPSNLLKQEVREPALYNAIITAIATGSTKLSEISSKVGEETSVCAAYIKNLISLGIIKKETPFGERSPRKTIYKIDDNLFRFWYRFIPDNIASINRGLADAVYEKISPMISDYMGAVFEDICIQYLWKLREGGEIPIAFTDLGRWWGNDIKHKCTAEIDIMGTDGENSALFGECKWTNKKIDTGVLNTLVERSQLFHYKNVRFYLFSKSGFTIGCKQKAAECGNVALVTFGEITKI
ncbi:MAG: ATP-binding protein, partial [Clostridiales Family XIII bacterium]|nr:ATP-binding protein [Clostridiales Family XIII bacterium]